MRSTEMVAHELVVLWPGSGGPRLSTAGRRRCSDGTQKL